VYPNFVLLFCSFEIWSLRVEVGSKGGGAEDTNRSISGKKKKTKQIDVDHTQGGISHSHKDSWQIQGEQRG
jgi:hypothetical protein